MILWYWTIIVLLTKGINEYDHPHYHHHRDPESELSLARLVIHRPLHTKPYTENSSKDCQDPEGAFWYPPPSIYRLELVDSHREVWEENEDDDIDEEILQGFGSVVLSFSVRESLSDTLSRSSRGWQKVGKIILCDVSLCDHLATTNSCTSSPRVHQLSGSQYPERVLWFSFRGHADHSRIRGDQDGARGSGQIYRPHARGSHSHQGMLALRYLAWGALYVLGRVTCLRIHDDLEQSRPSYDLRACLLHWDSTHVPDGIYQKSQNTSRVYIA